MIALDASTAVQPFRDGVYDIWELGRKLQALLGGSGYVSFRYADGSVVSLPSASLVHALVPSFERLLLDGRVTLGIHDGNLSVGLVGGDGALEALVAAHAADKATVSGSRIVKLVVSGSLSIGDFSAWAASKGLAGKTVSAQRVSNVSSATTTHVSGVPSTGLRVYASDSASIGVATFRGEWAISPTYKAAGLATPNTVGFYDAAEGAVEIRLESDKMSIEVPMRDADAGATTVRCSIPYRTAAGWEYLEVDTYSVARKDSIHTEAAKGTMTKFLLWPNWKMEGPSALDRTFRVYPGSPMSGEAPIVRVVNTTNGTLKLPHVWQFAKKSDGKGAVSVLSSIGLPPHACKEFEFCHNEATNCGYMFPLSVW